MRLFALVLTLFVLWAGPADAHPMPHSVVELTAHADAVDATLRLPVDDLRRASGLGPGDPALQGYLAEHLGASADGSPWNVRIGDVRVGGAEQTDTGAYRELTVRAELVPPSGAVPERFTLRYDAIVHQVVTHVVFVESPGGRLGTIRTDPRTMTVPPLTVDLGHGGGFAAMLSLGASHILEGTDHLLFLFTLLLPAALTASRGQWNGVAGPRRALRRITAITLAFTAGHSVALAVSAVGRWPVPSEPVEVFVAASILISAVHAIRPLFPGREAAVAGFFGLGHGMAFAFTLAELDLTTRQLVLSLLGFNVGIELVQLLLVALALPGLLVLARLRFQPFVRTLGAAVAALAATGWLLARLGMPNVVARVADGAATHPGWVIGALTVSAVAATLKRAPWRPEPPTPDQATAEQNRDLVRD